VPLKASFNAIFDSLVQQRTNETKIAELVASEIKKLSDSGIR